MVTILKSWYSTLFNNVKVVNRMVKQKSLKKDILVDNDGPFGFPYKNIHLSCSCLLPTPKTNK